MLRVRAAYATVLGVLLVAAAQAQQPGMIQTAPGPMFGPPQAAPVMPGPMMGPPMGGPMMGPPSMVVPASYGHGMPGPMMGDCCGSCGGCDMCVSDCGCDMCLGGCGQNGCGGCGDCFDGCLGCCDACCPPPGCPAIFNGSVEGTILVPILDGNVANGSFSSRTIPVNVNFGSADSELDRDHVFYSPRIWLHTQKCGLGVGGLWVLAGE